MYLKQSSQVACFGPFRLDLKAGELEKNDHRVRLHDQPFRVLNLLLEHTGEVVTREEIRRRLWPNDTVVEFDNGINAAIKKLRDALGDSADQPRYIETLARRGYRFLMPVEWEPSDSSSGGGVASLAAAEGPRPSVSPRSPVSLPAEAGQIPPSPINLSASRIGQRVSHYRVLDVLGGGGMGLVYRAEDIKLGRKVALKFLPEEMSADPVARERFEREARAASALNHPNICTIHEIEEHAGHPFIVMELLEGQTLRDLLEQSRVKSQESRADSQPGAGLPLGTMLELSTQIAAGLEAAHQQGIIHRDIKPANIFVTHQGQAKILDFGLAKLQEPVQGSGARDQEPGPDSDSVGAGSAKADPGSLVPDPRSLTPDSAPDPWSLTPDLTRTGIAIGTAGYMSPEQIRGEKLDARTDIFSFGLVLYEMSTGVRAFHGETAAVVHDQILQGVPARPRDVRPELPPKLEAVIECALEKDRERRYPSASAMRTDLAQLKTETRKAPSRERLITRRRVAAAVAMIALWAAVAYRYFRSRPALTDKDAVVVGDFTNTTGDSVFDDTLKQGLEVQLEQSPFFDLVSEKRVSEALKLMGRSPGERLTPEVAREVCQRTGGKAVLAGLVAALGSQYVIGLEAVNCATGDVLAQAQEQAAGKEAVLKALDHTALALRAKLGESRNSLQKYATPLEDATTPSLEALKAYSEARKVREAKGYTDAVPLFQQAAQLDPNFAMVYANLAHAYQGLWQISRANENARKAFDLRAKVSEHERFYIEASYYMIGTGELEKAKQAYQEYAQAYPRDCQPHENLAYIYSVLGDLDRSLDEEREALRLEPSDEEIWAGVAAYYVVCNQPAKAEAVLKQAQERKLQSVNLFWTRYLLAWREGDTPRIEQLAAEAKAIPGAEDVLLYGQAGIELRRGRVKRARALWEQSMDSARRIDAVERSANQRAGIAEWEAEFGLRQQALGDANLALKLAPYNKATSNGAAFVFARVGDTAKAEELVVGLDRAFPLDTEVQKFWLPSTRAQIALARKDPGRAVELIQQTATNPRYWTPPYELGNAYLMQRDSRNSAAVFQKIIDQPDGTPLARLGLGRALALEAGIDVTPDLDPAAPAAPIRRAAEDPPRAGQYGAQQSDVVAKARAAYADFLTYWKDADPDIPILKQAKAEYALLQ